MESNPPIAGRTSLTWVKSSASSAEGACVEVTAAPPGRTAVRDSKHPERTPLLFPSAQWAAFLDGLHGGRFERLP
ncbi:DUF397 domain-containing protein [Streptomyces carminius]|uniref:DUF397 domain-containing protein n=1 Tax=Streptomyces carminius TaxID=2665496 RepID=A0A2M8M069_9ACTN|nr:DUF397 domain-containing protein [Streptomyces carminius]PJE97601.1 DUF397 domain-containing protein [Streptomyces carminius]